MSAEIEQATETLVSSLLLVFADAEDDDSVPLRQLLEGLGRHCGVELTTGQLLTIEEEISVLEFRRRARLARQELAFRGVT